MMITGNCHCGAIKFSVDETPEQLVDCNCSICHRLGALWGHVLVSSVQIDAPNEGTIAYAQGDKTLAVHSCRICGCTTHWENLQPNGERMAVNFRMCTAQEVARYRIRKLDGADTWKFLD